MNAESILNLTLLVAYSPKCTSIEFSKWTRCNTMWLACTHGVSHRSTELSPCLPQNITLLPAAHFCIFPSSLLAAVLFTSLLVVITWDKHPWRHTLSGCCRKPGRNTTAHRQSEASRVVIVPVYKISFPCFRLASVASTRRVCMIAMLVLFMVGSINVS